MIQLKNALTACEIDVDKKELMAYDLRDTINLPALYNNGKRTFKKAAAALQAAWNDTTTMYDVAEIFFKNGCLCHSYCQMD